MIRLCTRTIAGAVLLGLFGLQQPALAGKILYQQCFTSRGNPTDGIKATLQAGGLFYSWSGYLVNETVVKNFNICDPTTKIFTGANNAGQNSITITPFANNVMIPLNGHLQFNSIRNNTALDEDATKTTLTMGANDSGTKIGAAVTRAAGDPEISITNDGTSSVLLLSMVAQVGNSEDPLDPDIFFVPDGSVVSITPALQSSNDTILPGETGVFTFPVGDAANWSFQYSYSYEGDSYTELLATDVPELNSCGLLAIGVAGLVILRRNSRGLSFSREKMARRAR